MTIKAVPFDPVHMEFCDFHEQFVEQAKRESGDNLLNVSKEAWTFIDGGIVIAIVGIVETHAGCGYLWTYMSNQAGPHMTRITRFTKDLIARINMVRIEATVVKNFRAAHRWMRILDFKRETTRPMKRWDGVNDYHLYSKVYV